MAEAPTGDELLTPDDAVSVLEEILEAQNHSRFLGLQLNVPDYIVTGIHTHYTDPKDRLYYVLVEFLQRRYPRPTWRAIVTALKTPVVNLPQLAMRVEAAHFPDPTASHEAPPPEATTSTATRSAVAITETSSSPTSGERDTGSSAVVTEEAAHLPDPTTTDDPPPETTTSTVTIPTSDEATSGTPHVAHSGTAPTDTDPLPEATTSTETSDAVTSPPVPDTSEVDTSLSVLSAPRSLDSKPTLPELLTLKTSSDSTVNIVEQIGTNYSTLGPLLLNDDTGAVTSAIINQHHHNAVAINQEILTRWLLGQGKLPVTWSTLLGVLRNVGLSELAQMVRKNLNISETSPEQTFTSDQSPVTSKVPQQRSESHLSTTDHEAHQPPSPPQGQMTVQYVQAQIKKFEKRFNALKNSIQECLEKLRVPVKKVAGALTSLPADDVDEHKQFLESHLSALYQAPDHSELFGTMNFHWNYQNPQLLDHLIGEFDLEGVKGEMKTYKGDLQKFRKKTPLKLFCQSQKQKRIKPPPDFHEMVAEFDWPDDVTLEVVEEFRQGYAGHYNLRECAMMLAVVLPGSFIITWFIPSSIVEKVKVKVPTSILKKYSVTKLEIAGECMYSEVMNRVSTTTPSPSDGPSTPPAAITAAMQRAASHQLSKGRTVSQMASSTEQDFPFVEQPSEDFFCPVTYGLLLQPHLTECCGKHLSQEAATRIQEEGGPCPLCNEPCLKTMLDKNIRRQVNELHVFCRHEDRGCGWQGELSDLERHVQSCPMKTTPLMTDPLKLPVYSDGEMTSGTEQDKTRQSRHQSTPQAARPVAVPHSISPSKQQKLTVKLKKKKKAPRVISRGSATTETSREFLREAMKKGYVHITLVKVIVVGPAGVGKTCFVYLLLSKPPPSPEERESTGCAERSIQIIRVGKEGKEWSEISTQEFQEMIAEAVPILYEELKSKGKGIEELDEILSELEGKEEDGEGEGEGERKVEAEGEKVVEEEREVDGEVEREEKVNNEKDEEGDKEKEQMDKEVGKKQEENESSSETKMQGMVKQPLMEWFRNLRSW